jgi:hypothetical protein
MSYTKNRLELQLYYKRGINMKRKVLLFLSIIMAFSFLSCKVEENVISAKFIEACPKDYMVNLEVPEATKNLKDLGDLATSYLDTVRFTRDVNTSVHQWLSWVETIVQYPATSYSDTRAVWGPWLPDDGLSSVEYRFVMNLNPDESFDFAFEIKPKDTADTEFVPVYIGHVDAGGNPTVNSGTLTFDNTAAASVDLAVTATGSITIQYDYTNGQKDIYVEFDQFAEAQDGDLITANYHYHAATGAEGYFDFETWVDIHAGSEDAELYPNIEHMELRSRWTINGDGRTDVIITGEDLDEAGVTSFRKSECWDTTFHSTFMSEAVTIPPDPDHVEVKWGEETSCENFLTWDGPEL